MWGGKFPRFVGRPPISWGSSQDVLGRRGQFRVSRSLPPYKAHMPSRDRPAPLILRRGPEWRLPHSDHLPPSGRAQLRWEGLLSSDLKYRSWKCPRGRCEFLLWGPTLSGLPAPLGHLLKPKMPPPHDPPSSCSWKLESACHPLWRVLESRPQTPGCGWDGLRNRPHPPGHLFSGLDLGTLCCPFLRVLLGRVGLLPGNAGLLSSCLCAWAPGMLDEPGVCGAGAGGGKPSLAHPPRRPRTRSQAPCGHDGWSKSRSSHHAHTYRGGGGVAGRACWSPRV